MTTVLNSVASQRGLRIRYCGPASKEKHEGFPTLAYAMPDAIFALTAAEREARAVTSSDLCILDDERFFIRCVMSVPVLGCDDKLDYGPWVEVAARDFSRYAVHFSSSGHPAWTTAFGRIANALPACPETTLDLACDIHRSADPAQRPYVVIVDHRHRIAEAQANGMSLPHAMEIVSQMKGYLLLVS
jgi:hypothetical protein